MSLKPSISLFRTFFCKFFAANAKLASFFVTAFTGISDMIAIVGREGLTSLRLDDVDSNLAG